MRLKPFILLFFALLIFDANAYANDLDNCLDTCEKGMYRQGVQCLLILAAEGNAEAQYYISRAYEHGIAVESDVDTMWHWLLKAAEKGLAEAKYRIFYHYKFSGLTPESDNRHKADIWLQKAIDAGSSSALIWKGVLEKPKDQNLDFQYYKKALKGLLKQRQTPFNLERFNFILEIYFEGKDTEEHGDVYNNWERGSEV